LPARLGAEDLRASRTRTRHQDPTAPATPLLIRRARDSPPP
jgi:hypothetical protein